MPKFFVVSLDGLSLIGEDAADAVRKAPADVDLPANVSLISEENVETFFVAEPGNSSTSTVTRQRPPRSPQGLIVSRVSDEAVAVTWREVPAAEEYEVTATGVSPVVVPADTPAPRVELNVASGEVAVVARANGVASPPAVAGIPTV